MANLRAGKAFVVQILHDVGSAVRGRYVVRFDRADKKMYVSSLQESKLAGYAITADEIGQEIDIWGANFRWLQDDNSRCLAYAPQARATNKCDARLVAELQPDLASVKGDIIDLGAERLITVLETHLRDPEAVMRRAAPCARNPGLVQTHVADRFLADALFFDAGVVPFITKPQLRAKAERLVERAVDHLIKTAAPTSKTSYTACYGGVDIITPYSITKALEEQQRLRPREDVAAYIRKQWSNVLAEGAIEANGERNSIDRTQFANGFAAYLRLAVAAEHYGVKALQPWTDRGVSLLLAEQTNRPGQQCSEAKGTFEQPIGGWPHSNQDCSQRLGYHGFIVDGLIALHDHYRRTGVCRTDGDRCARIENSLRAALTWIIGLKDQSSGDALYDHAQRSSSTPLKVGTGNIAGADAGFRIITHLHLAARAEMTTLVAAMTLGIATRPSYVPIGAYLNAVASSR